MSLPERKHPHHKPSVSWFELFYDLIIVAIVAQSGKVFLSSPTWQTSGLIISALLTLFTVWLLVTVSHSLVPANDPVRRAILLVQMVLLAVAALSLGKGGLPSWIGFLSASGAFALLSIVFWRNTRQEPQIGQTLRAIAIGSAAGSAVLALSALAVLPVPEDSVLWLATICNLIAVAVTLTPILGRSLRELVRLDALDLPHLEERFALFVIIVLGESFVGLLLSLGRLGYVPSPGYFLLTFAIAFSVWAIYFNSLVPSRMPNTLAGLRIWILGHALLVVAIVAMAVEFTDLSLSREAGRGLEFDGNWTPLPLLEIVVALALLTYVAQGVPRSLFRVQVIAAVILALLSAVDVATSSSTSDVYTLMGACVMIGNSIACSVLRLRSDRKQAQPEVTGDATGG